MSAMVPLIGFSPKIWYDKKYFTGGWQTADKKPAGVEVDAGRGKG